MKYILKLYVVDGSGNSIRAVNNLKKIAKKFIEGKYVLEIIDIAEAQKLAADAGIIATPALVKSLPPPPRKVIGDLSDTEKVVLGLGLGAIVKDDAKEEDES
jgi:circadian clock protein KaiB